MFLNIQPPAMSVLLVFRKSGFIKSSSSSERSINVQELIVTHWLGKVLNQPQELERSRYFNG